MNFAHMIGEHHYDSFNQQIWHTVTSWAGFILAIVLGAILVYVVYQSNRKDAKEKIKK